MAVGEVGINIKIDTTMKIEEQVLSREQMAHLAE